MEVEGGLEDGTKRRKMEVEGGLEDGTKRRKMEGEHERKVTQVAALPLRLLVMLVCLLPAF